MNRVLPWIVAGLLVIGFLQPAGATTFAILLDRRPDDDEVDMVSNPLYEPSGNQGENPLYEPKSLSFTTPSLWPGEPATLGVVMDVDLPRNLPPAPAGAFVFGLTLTVQSTGQELHKLPAPLTITFDMDREYDFDFELGYLNESTGEWQIENATLVKKDGSLLCGTTDHFSYFYIAPVPEPASWLLALVGAVAFAVFRARSRKLAPVS